MDLGKLAGIGAQVTQTVAQGLGASGNPGDKQAAAILAAISKSIAGGGGGGQQA